MEVLARKTPLGVQVARTALLEGFRKAEGRNPTGNVLALLMAQSALETGNWTEIRNNNFGNIKTGSSWEGDWTTFPCGESGTSYPAGDPHCYFRSYDSPEEGASDYVRLITRRSHWHHGLLSGDPDIFNQALSLSRPEQGIYPYYTADPEKYGRVLKNRFLKYGGELPKAVAGDSCSGSQPESQDTESSEPFVASLKPLGAEYPPGSATLPTVRPGMEGFAVEVVQRLIGARPDGKYGPKTRAILQHEQSKRGLRPDGIVGRKTWRGLSTR